MKKRILCFVMAITLSLSAISIRISRHYSLSCEAFAEIGIKGDITKDINQLVLESLNLRKQYYRIIYKQDGGISHLEIDTNAINEVCNEICQEIYTLVCEKNRYYGIPIGNTLGSSYLSGKGPRLRVNIVPIGYVNYKINSEFSSGGINQTLYRITADFALEIGCLAPFHECKTNIHVPLVLSEILISGPVPEILLAS